MDLHLSGRVAVVTGASRGIGLAVTRALAEEGARVVAGARTLTPDLRALVAASGGAVRALSVDLSTQEAADRLVGEAVSAFGGVDVLVNNVGGVRPRMGGFLSITDEQWTWGLDVNLLVAVRATRAALPHLKAGSNIVNVSTVMSFLADPDVYDYTAGKAALSNFSKALSKEVGPKGVRVNTVSPGPVETELWTREDGIAPTVVRAVGVDQEAFLKEMASRMVTGRFTKAEEVADVVLFLASDRAANVHGSDFSIDGGMITTM
ncbi:SDR family NAD(P)-dependent oxidoreductase [Saccharothrix syringae]|uniref:SDR family oxidoreductase n=1 Tax=Saccharothrix syringae TaxID=103733 RepID=A0A5Q0H671_SACSY|nr:SDR family oxidoreductase [Saccharothrix syringae]QFZ21687.1 SDR family oxidoreductase [Saccharothrix syringae]